MARKAGGVDQLAEAREALRTAKTADELRAAQAVVLPLELGLLPNISARILLNQYQPIRDHRHRVLHRALLSGG